MKQRMIIDNEFLTVRDWEKTWMEHCEGGGTMIKNGNATRMLWRHIADFKYPPSRNDWKVLKKLVIGSRRIGNLNLTLKRNPGL